MEETELRANKDPGDAKVLMVHPVTTVNMAEMERKGQREDKAH